jgi:ribonuclease VapC
MFIDTSVFVAILSAEPDADEFATIIERAKVRLTSGLVLLEAAMRLSTKLDIDPLAVEIRLDAFLAEAQISVIPITDAISRKAIAAFTKYGKGRGSKAQLNLADCLSYSCAKVHRAPLLFKGNDFTHTDIDPA